ncbi:MAG: MazG family protein [Lachnospiraceae bacterium]|nr:MazG family protein [Lachnospiraceae bacterium]
MKSFEELVEVVARLRGEGGCPWDREQTHATLKAPCIEEAAEVVCGINILDKTGNASNLLEELGDLMFQVVMHARIAEEEGLFTIEDVTRAITEKMIRRHPHVFGDVTVSDTGEVLKNWEEIKKLEKKGKTDDDLYIDDAFDESIELIERARRRKAEKRKKAAAQR